MLVTAYGIADAGGFPALMLVVGGTPVDCSVSPEPRQDKASCFTGSIGAAIYGKILTGVTLMPFRGLGSKRTKNLCKAVSRNLPRSLALSRHASATGKHPARSKLGSGRRTWKLCNCPAVAGRAGLTWAFRSRAPQFTSSATLFSLMRLISSANRAPGYQAGRLSACVPITSVGILFQHGWPRLQRDGEEG